MFSAYFEECYLKFFDGGSLLTAVIHPHIQMSKLPNIGAVISHAYLVCGFLPIRIAFPCLAAMLFGSTANFPEKFLVEAFVDSLSVHDAGIFKEAFNVIDSTSKLFPSTI